MDQTPKVIIEWPRGLTGQPAIFPIAGTLEQAEEITRIVERALAVAGNGN